MPAVEFHSRDPAPLPVGHASTPASPAGCTHLPQQVPLVAPVYPSRSHWLHTYPSGSHWLHTPNLAGPIGYTHLPQQILLVTHLPQQVPLVTQVDPSRPKRLHMSTPASVPLAASPTGCKHLAQQVPLVTHVVGEGEAVQAAAGLAGVRLQPDVGVEQGSVQTHQQHQACDHHRRLADPTPPAVTKADRSCSTSDCVPSAGLSCLGQLVH